MDIEVARPEDAAATLVLQRAVLAEGRWFVTAADELDATLERRARLIEAYQRSDNSVWLVARRGASLVGYLTLEGGGLRATRHVARLAILVDARHRGVGVGRSLMEAGLGWAQANPVLEKVGLNVFADNETAIALYRRMGFVEEGRRPGEYRVGDVHRDDVLLYRRV